MKENQPKNPEKNDQTHSIRDKKLQSSIINHLPSHFIFWKNTEGVYLGCNEAFAKSLGFKSPDEVIGKTDYDLPVKKEDSDAYRADDKEVMTSKKPKLNLEEPQTLANGETRILLTSKVPLLDEDAQVYGVLAIYSDITSEKEAEALRSKQALINNAAQVSHDIRSPLAALNTVLRNLSALPEDQRILIRNAVSRINDIANNLLVEYRDEPKEIVQKQRISPELISSLLDSLISEKKAQISEKNIDLNLEMQTNAFGLFVTIDPIQFKRMISNLLNNAIEAINEQGEVIVHLEKYQDNVRISLKDSGKGIPADILEKIKRGGTSLNKVGGTGLGISTSLAIIKEYGGHFDMVSKQNEGTTVIIDLPIATIPAWFQEELILQKDSTLIIVDDDESIHAIWDTRCQSLLPNITIKHFNHSKTLDEYCASADLSKTQFLVDYELLGSPEVGLELIERLNLSNHAILVTSRYEEAKVRTHADKLGVKIIPKNYSPYIPISLASNDTPKLIFIDDDKMLTGVWEREAEIKGIFIKTFNSTAELKKILPSLAKDTPIYIDSNLSEAISGEDFSKELHEQGFTALYIASGHPRGYFGDLPWIKDFISKEPPF